MKMDISSLDTPQYKAYKGLAKLMAIIIILGVAAFGDVIYIIEMQSIFGGVGMLVVFCYLGAAMGFLATCYLLLGKLSVFAPGSQMLASWIVLAMEVIIIALNIMYVFMHDKGGVLSAWGWLSCTTPVWHLVGVIIVLMLDPGQKRVHLAREMAEKRDERKMRLEHATQMARMEMEEQQLQHLTKALKEKSHGTVVISAVDAYADAITAQLLSEMSGKALPPPKNDGRDNGFGKLKA